MLSCKNITQQASDYLDSKLSFGQRIHFKIHLFMCVHCRRYVHQLQVTIGALTGFKPEPPPEANIEEVLKILRQHGTTKADGNKQ